MNNIKEMLAEANNLMKSDKIYEAVKVYESILLIQPNEIEALINISDGYLKIEMPNRAEKYAKKAYDLHRFEDDMATVNYSSVLINFKKYQLAIDILENESTLGSTNYLVYNNLGYTYFLTEVYAKALDNYNISILIRENNPLAYCNRGNLKYFIFNDNSGIQDLELAHKYGDFEATMILQKIIRDKTLLS